MKLSRCVVIYCTHLLGLRVTSRRWGSGKDQKAGAASVNTHHANTTVIYRESCQSRGQLTFTHSFQREISVDRDFRIRSPFPSGPLPRPCVFVCCWVELTQSWSSRQRTLMVIFNVCEPVFGGRLSLCWDNRRRESLLRQSVVKVRQANKSRTIMNWIVMSLLSVFELKRYTKHRLFAPGVHWPTAVFLLHRELLVKESIYPYHKHFFSISKILIVTATRWERVEFCLHCLFYSAKPTDLDMRSCSHRVLWNHWYHLLK